MQTFDAPVGAVLAAEVDGSKEDVSSPRRPSSLFGTGGFGLFLGGDVQFIWLDAVPTTWVSAAVVTRTPDLGFELGVAGRAMIHEGEARPAKSTQIRTGSWETGLVAAWSPLPEALVAPGVQLELDVGTLSWCLGSDEGTDFGVALTPSAQAQLHLSSGVRLGLRFGYRIPALLDAAALSRFKAGAPVASLSLQVGKQDFRFAPTAERSKRPEKAKGTKAEEKEEQRRPSEDSTKPAAGGGS